MFQAEYESLNLKFKKPAGTSRGKLLEKPGYLLKLKRKGQANYAVGECSLIPGLSPDPENEIVEEIASLCNAVNDGSDPWSIQPTEKFPALCFAWEMLLLDLLNGCQRLLIRSDFMNEKKSIPINGLIWMGDSDDMFKQAMDKIASGYPCIKMKVGALDFASELKLLKRIRQTDSAKNIEIRLDANGAFNEKDVFEKLDRLSDFNIHSIEQPVKPGQIQLMSDICKDPAIPVALDEELIGVYGEEKRALLLDTIKPQYIILKPSLLGGLNASRMWADLAEERNIKWWATSALESSIGLNAIAQWTAFMNTGMPQGLGTGQLFTNQIKSPLCVENGALHYRNKIEWGI